MQEGAVAAFLLGIRIHGVVGLILAQLVHDLFLDDVLDEFLRVVF